jgi:small subunit ribosomal protein S16
MSVRVRLTRVGSKKNPIWRVVVADQRSPRDGRVIETIGRYNAQTDPSEIVLDRDRLQYWLDRGAQPSHTVKKLMRSAPSAPAEGSDPEDASAPSPAETGV